MTIDRTQWDLVVVGSGAAGLSAAVSYLERRQEQGGEQAQALVLERGTEESQPGNSRWTGGFLMMKDADTVGDDLAQEQIAYASGGIDTSPARHVPVAKAYFQKLEKLAPLTTGWLRGLGIEFQSNADSYIVPNGLSTRPVGEGPAVIDALTKRLKELGGELRFNTTALRLVESESGEIAGVRVRNTAGKTEILGARDVVLASGGFQGNPEMMTTYLGDKAGRLNTIAPGGTFNKGEGIRMALEMGAAPSGQWDMIHGEPSDPRSKRPDAVNTLYPFGILVGMDGKRFVDEGEDMFQETFEALAFQIFRKPGQLAYIIADSRIAASEDIRRFSRGMFTEDKPFTAKSIESLARILDLPIDTLQATVQEYNERCADDDSAFNPRDLDGLSTTGLTPAKSNWARRIDEGPFLAWPVVCSTCFTFGGISTNEDAEVLSADANPIPHLYSAGEMTGVFYTRYSGGISFLRSLTYGRVAGQNAADSYAGNTK
jgi:tricarballylate dehydrogenase